MTNWASSLLAAVIFAAPLTTLAQSAATLRALLIEYRCPVVDRLERIYEAGDPASQRDRFLAVTLSGHPHGYVQCMFVERRTRILCEAASGYWYDKPGTLRTFRQPAEAIVGTGPPRVRHRRLAGKFFDRLRRRRSAGSERHRRLHSKGAARRLWRPGGVSPPIQRAVCASRHIQMRSGELSVVRPDRIEPSGNSVSPRGGRRTYCDCVCGFLRRGAGVEACGAVAGCCAYQASA